MPYGRCVVVLLYVFVCIEHGVVEYLDVCNDEVCLFLYMCVRIPWGARSACRGGADLTFVL